jgi:integrating conjugative element membrane protein (TIGR03747 family)
MAEAVTDPRRRVVKEGLISKSLTAMAKVIQWLLLSLVFSIIVEWAGMVLWWPDEGLEHSRIMLAREISYLDNDFTRSVVTSDPARFAKRFADNTYHYLFEVTRFVEFIYWVSPLPTTNEQGLRPTLHNIFHPIAEFVIAMMQVTQVFSVRLAILALAMPVFLLFSLVALVTYVAGVGAGRARLSTTTQRRQQYPWSFWHGLFILPYHSVCIRPSLFCLS